MIIQCGKCETRFRFDEALIEGDGVWVRCSRCQHVFFQERSAGEPPSSAVSASGGEIPSVRVSDARHRVEERLAATEGQTARAEMERAEMPPASTGVEGGGYPEIEKEISLEGLNGDMGREDFGGPAVDEEREDDAEEPEEEPAEAAAGKRRWGLAILKLFLLLVLIVIVSGGISLWFFPEIRTQALEWASPWLRGVPFVEKFLGKRPTGSDAVLLPVRIKEVRQRTVTNLLAGNLHVIEGVAVNQSSHPLARISVRLVIADAYDVVLGEKVSYCGNTLTDAELGALSEAEIQRELSTPQGTDVSNERVVPSGEIPFMIVFSQERTGTIKTTVTFAGAERAL